MTGTAIPLHPLFAAELPGFDVRCAGEREVREFEAAMARFAVVVLHDQCISDEQQIAFSRRFGPLELPPSVSPAGAAARPPRIAPQMYDVSNVDAAGRILPPDDPKHVSNRANEALHTDSSFNALPTKWSFLSARVVPPEGGDTHFVDARAVWDALPESLRQRARGAVAEHSFWKMRAAYRVDPRVRESMPPARHPLVRRIAESGREALYAGAHATHVVGWAREDSDAFLGELMAFASRPEFLYVHRWRVGDLVVWDNRCTLHSATHFDSARHARDLRRTTINEHGPEISSTDALRLGLLSAQGPHQPPPGPP